MNDEEIVRGAYLKTLGVIRCLTNHWLGPFFVLMFVIWLLSCLFKWSTDDSDRDSWHKSGMSVRTDYKTGVQYLGTSNGGITPRLDKNGQIMVISNQ